MGKKSMTDARRKESDIKSKGSASKRSLEDGKNTNYVTTGGAGFIPNTSLSPVDMLRKKIYKSVSPNDSYNIKAFLINLVGDNDVYNQYMKVFGSTNKFYPENERNNIDTEAYKIADEMLATYLDIPVEDRHSNVRLTKSKYQDAYSLPLLDNIKQQIIRKTDDLPVGKNKSVVLDAMLGLGKTAIGKGHDARGEYRSYGDRYDLNPTRGIFATKRIPVLENIGDVSMGVGKPFDVYDRIYLDDYYNVPKEDRGGNYIPEITIIGKRNKKSSGGSIHIAPSKRGTFTAAATKHGMGVQEFASRVLRNKDSYSPAMVKKANFARNASKWNH